MKKIFVLFLSIFAFSGIKSQVEPLLLYKAANNKQCIHWVNETMSKMTLREKVGQLIIYTIDPKNTKTNIRLLNKTIKSYGIGGVLFSNGTISDQAAVTNKAQSLTKIPLMIMCDGEWGLAMRLRGMPAFPKNMTLGCIEDDKLIYEYGKEVARECKIMGIQVNFAPVADVNTNPKNPVINSRSFGEMPIRVANKVIAYACGLESNGILSVCKHFPGHGDTSIDSHKALPTLPFSRERLDSIELYPFKQAIQAGISGIMVGHLQVPIFDPIGGLPSSLSRNIVYSLLTEELKFKGLIFTDALAMRSVSNEKNVCLQALRAGNDMILAPADLQNEIDNIMIGIANGRLSIADVNNKCRKVLTYKYILGLSHKPFINTSRLFGRLNTPKARDLIHRLNMAAITVVDNKKKIIPISPDVKKIAVLSVGSLKEIDPFVKKLESYTNIKCFSLKKDIPYNEQNILTDSLKQYNRIIVAVSESQLTPYETFFNHFTPGKPLLFVFFTPSKLMTAFTHSIKFSSATIACHSTRTDVETETAKIIFGKATANGRISVAIGNLFKAGTGETISPYTPYHYIPEEYGINSNILKNIDKIVYTGIKMKAYPGCQIVILKDGRTIYDKCFGKQTYTSRSVVRHTDMYDLASLSKTTGTLLAIMKLYDKGLLSLTDKISIYLPFLRHTNKKDITIQQLLFHESGLPAGTSFYMDAIDSKSYKGSLYRNGKDKNHPIQVNYNTWANPYFKFKPNLISSKSRTGYSMQICDNLWLNDSFKNVILKKISKLALGSKHYEYSDIGFILLQQIIEKISGTSLDKYLQQTFFRPMSLDHTCYLPLRYYKKNEITPSSIDGFLRKEELRGYVNDESAAFLGGVSGNAGLFSSAENVALLYQMVLNNGEINGRKYLSEETCKLFTTRTSRISRRGIGFDKPDKKNLSSSPCAPSTPITVYGHTGYTGTCAWVDPTNEIVYVFLSNRSYPNAWENKLHTLKIRERIQETIYQSLLHKKNN